MFTADASSPRPFAPPRRAGNLASLVAILVLLLIGYFVVMPAAERWGRGAAATANLLLESVFRGLGAMVSDVFQADCRRVEHSDEAIALVGEPIRCAPLEESEWFDTAGSNHVEFTFEFTGPRGTGQAHVVAVSAETGLQLKSVAVTGPAGDVTRLLEP